LNKLIEARIMVIDAVLYVPSLFDARAEIIKIQTLLGLHGIQLKISHRGDIYI